MATDADAWVQEWKEAFATSYSAGSVETWVGKRVEIERGEETFFFNVIGYARILITSEEDHAEQLAIITDEGKQIALKTGDKVRVVEEG